VAAAAIADAAGGTKQLVAYVVGRNGELPSGRAAGLLEIGYRNT
jgi:hypothetical protein